MMIPNSTTNHQAIIQFEGKWYFFSTRVCPAAENTGDQYASTGFSKPRRHNPAHHAGERRVEGQSARQQA